MTPPGHVHNPAGDTGTPSRRALLKRGAWAAPVVALTVATPQAAASAGQATTRFNTTPQMFIQGSAWSPARNGSVALGYRFETKFENIYQPHAVTILTTDLVISYPSAYIADLPLTNLSNGLVEVGRAVSGETITFRLRLTETIANAASSSDMSWVATAAPGVSTSQAVPFSVTLTSPQSSTTLAHSGTNPTW
ncbi:MULTISPECIES: hypothetical protein [unclassified Pseudoclavibacter]|uniref:hypothetical protein n=1 Tax=unclassified Pseudoclavibacter TaxID=2615177 RepID=UPI001BABB437|nr:hypothetical protein [Pseudoclavibacter sp. Marseille-Q4354]MBS3177816.1 hypothetical protein [Pseudoclavibacter sp. Marseille-Q4354]